MTSSVPSKWKFRQCFGEQRSLETIREGDMLTAVEFSQNGDFVATGDRAGRVVLFEQSYKHVDLDEEDEKMDLDQSSSSKTLPLFSQSRSKLRRKLSAKKTPSYKFQAEFQSHKAGFDCLKSLEIEEKINKIKWCKPTNDALFLLTTNDKTIKLWKVSEQSARLISNQNLHDSEKTTSPKGGNDRIPTFPNYSSDNKAQNGLSSKISLSLEKLKVPRFRTQEVKIRTQEKKVFSNAHSYHINSIAVVSDGESYLSSDDLRVNLWNLNLSEEVYNVIDIKPDNMDNLTEVITSCDAHPCNNSLFIYSSSKGTIKLNDLRTRSKCDSNPLHQRVFQDSTDYYKNWVSGSDGTDGSDPDNININDTSGGFMQQNVAFFSEILASISDVKFINDGRSIVSRDYLSVKIWDSRKETEPTEVISFLEHLKPELKDLYRTESIFDKFEVSGNRNGNLLSSGSYKSSFYIFDCDKKTSTCVDVLKEGENVVKMYNEPDASLNHNEVKEQVPDSENRMQLDDVGICADADVENDRFPDHKQKALHLALHPDMDCLAVAIENNLYIYGDSP